MARWDALTRDEREKVVRALIRDGHSAARIAETLGTTRNAVCGFCHRRGISLPGTLAGRRASADGSDGYAHKRPKNDRSAAGGHATRAKAGVTLATPTVAPVHETGRFVALTENADSPSDSHTVTMAGPATAGARVSLPPEAGAPAEPERAAEAAGVSFLRLTDRHCKRPLWADGRPPAIDAMLFCGAPARPGSSWCAACAPRLGGAGRPVEAELVRHDRKGRPPGSRRIAA